MAGTDATTLGGDSENASKPGWEPGWGTAGVLAAALAALGAWMILQPPVVVLPTPITTQVTDAQDTGRPQVSGDNAPVLVEFTLDNTLQGLDRNILGAALTVLPTRDVPIAGPMPIDALIQQQFAVTQQIDPALFDLLAQRIRGSSEMLSNGTMVAAGTARIPQLTPFVAVDNPLNAIVELQTNEPSSLKRPRLTSGADAVSAPQKPASTSYLLQATVGELKTAAWQTIINAPNDGAQFRYIAKQFTVNISAAAARASAPMSYTAPADYAWRQRLQNADRDVTMFVLDTCWPDTQAWSESRRELDALAQALRKANGLPNGVTVPSLLATGSFPDPHSGSTHCREVADSLKAFSGLSKRVHLIYVPMTRDQRADDVLSEILWLHFALEDLRGNTQPSPSLIKKATEYADKGVASQLPTVSDWPNGIEFAANKALLDGMFRLADLRGERESTRYFINDSWTTNDGDIYRGAVWPEAGFVVAAVGNDKDVDVNHDKIAYAGLAAGYKSGVAVMTMDSTGTVVCDSSKVALVAGDAGAVGYAGDITGHCASSFAAPRVSWILAAWETMRPKTSTENYLDWRNRLRKLLEPSIPAGATPQEQHFLFNPARFFVQ